MVLQPFLSRHLRAWVCTELRNINHRNSFLSCQYGRSVFNSSREGRAPSVQVIKQLWTVTRPIYSSEMTLQKQLQMLSPCVSISRGKKSRGRTKRGKEEVLSDDDDDDDDDEEDWMEESGLGYKDIKVRVPSLRVDSVLKSGLNMSRNKVENAFYSSRLRVNENKILKKSKQLEEGDEIDLIKGVSKNNPEMINVARLVILRVGEYNEETDKLTVMLRRYQNLLIRKYEDYKIGEE